MDRNAKKTGKMQVFFPYAILVFQIFWQKTFYRSQIGAISSKEKRSPLLCSVEEWSEIVQTTVHYKNFCCLQNAFPYPWWIMCLNSQMPMPS